MWDGKNLKLVKLQLKYTKLIITYMYVYLYLEKGWWKKVTWGVWTWHIKSDDEWIKKIVEEGVENENIDLNDIPNSNEVWLKVKSKVVGKKMMFLSSHL